MKMILLKNHLHQLKKHLHVLCSRCGHCKRTMPAYQRITDSYKNDSNITVIKVDCDQNKDIASEHNIQGFPTFRLYPNGMNNKNNYEEYEGGRNYEDFDEYIKSLK